MHHLPRKAIASTPKLANRAPFPLVIESFLMGAPDYTVGHYDREGSMILDEFHNFLANLDVFTKIAMKHMPGAHFFGLCIFGGYNTDSGLRRLAEVRTIERNCRKRPSPQPLLGFLAQTPKKFVVSHRTLVPTAAPSPGGNLPDVAGSADEPALGRAASGVDAHQRHRI